MTNVVSSWKLNQDNECVLMKSYHVYAPHFQSEMKIQPVVIWSLTMKKDLR